MTTGWGKGFVPQHSLQNISMGIPLFRAATTCPQTAAFAIFNIVGGRVLMTYLAGEITVLLGAVGNLTIEENPTAGTTEVVGTALAIGTYPQGDMVGITGLDNAACVPAAAGGIPAMTNQGRVLRVGTLDWRQTASSTGEIQWFCTYIPLDDGAYMTVA